MLTTTSSLFARQIQLSDHHVLTSLSLAMSDSWHKMQLISYVFSHRRWTTFVHWLADSLLQLHPVDDISVTSVC